MLKRISAFSFGYNLIEGGYPFIEAIEAVKNHVDDVYFVDCQSTDETRKVLEKLGVNILEGEWGNKAGDTLRKAHFLYKKCAGEIIVHFEADEVYDDSLISQIRLFIEKEHYDISVKRIQVEQNFQRVRWWPHFVHRVFPKDKYTLKDGNSTNRKDSPDMLYINSGGYLWDCTNCFRDNWLSRIDNQTKLWGNSNYLIAPEHINEKNTLDRFETIQRLKDPLWECQQTPLKIPKRLENLVGMIKYTPFKICCI